MKRRTPLNCAPALGLCAVALLAAGSARPQRAPAPHARAEHARARRAPMLKPPLAFEENRGQAGSAARFLSRGPGFSLALSPTEAVISVARRSGQGTSPARAAVKLRLEKANRAPRLAGVEKQPGIVNYLIGNDPKQWRTHIPTYARVQYDSVYPGIDLVYHGSQGTLEYDFEVAPGADPNQIRLSAEGAQRVELSKNGDLLLHVPGGTLVQHKPIAYQLVGATKRQVPAEFVVEPASPTPNAQRPTPHVAFRLARYDVTKPLVIDPTLVFSTFLGGTGNEFVEDVAADSTGCLYISGSTGATDFPTASPYQDQNAGTNDAFVTKLSADGGTMLFSTYLGGTGSEDTPELALDGTNRVCIAGNTTSPDFPTTDGAFQEAAGGGQDGFVAMLTANGASLVYATYFGGTGVDYCTGLALSANGSPCIAGGTSSEEGFPLAHAIQSTVAASYDVFAARLSPGGTSLEYSTLLGGDNYERATAIAVAEDDSAYVAGFTASSDYPHPSAYQSSCGGSYDGFVSKLTWDESTSALSLAYSTYLGGTESDSVYDIAVDSAGAAYVCGATASSGFPTTSGVYRTTYGAGEAFITKLSASGSSLTYSTFLGGSTSSDTAYGLALDNGEVVVTGATHSTDFPTLFAYQGTYGGNQDAFIARINSTAASLLYSSYLGGTNNDFAQDVVVVGSEVVVVGSTTSSDFPTVDAVDGTTDSWEAFVASLNFTPSPTELTATEGSNGYPVLSWTDNNTTETGFSIERSLPTDPLVFSEVVTASANVHSGVEDTTATPGLDYVYRVRAVLGASSYSVYSNEATFTPSAPTAPSSLTVSLDATGSIALLSWTDSSNNETGFYVQVSYDAGVNWVDAGNTAANATSASAGPYAAESVLHFRVLSSNNAGTGVSGTVARAFFPTNLTASEGSNGKPRLSWDDEFSDETAFSIERQTVSTLDGFTEVLTTAANAHTNVEDTTATPGVRYEYRVRAKIGANYSASSLIATFIPSAPTAPSDLNAATSVSGTSVTLTWTDNSNNEVRFSVERSDDGGAMWNPLTNVAADGTSTTDSPVDPTLVYYYRVTAVNESGSATSEEAESSPQAPSDLAAEAVSGETIEVTWTDNSSDELGFELERKVGSGSYMLLADLAPNSRTYQHTDLAPNTTYTYRVRSYCDSVSAWAGPAGATTFTDAPQAPSNLKVYSPDRGSVVLTWMDNSTDETGFKVYRRIGSSGAYSLLTTAAADANTYTDATTTGDTKYTYTVAAYNARGTSRAASEQSVTTLWGPESLTASAATTAQINLTWKDMTLYEDGYSIERKKGSGSYYEVGRAGGKVGKNQTLTYSDTGLTSGISYTYRVRAYNSNATSLYATGSSITTTGAPEPSLRVTPLHKSFGRVPKGGSRTATFTVKNIGKKREEVTIGALTGTFEVLGRRRLTLGPGGTRTFKVRFTAGQPGSHNAVLPVSCQHGEVVKIRLEGRSTRG